MESESEEEITERCETCFFFPELCKAHYKPPNSAKSIVIVQEHIFIPEYFMEIRQQRNQTPIREPDLEDDFNSS